MDQSLPRLVVGLPHLASPLGGDSVLLERKGILSELAQRSIVFRLSSSAPSLSPESAWLGLEPEKWSFAQGPLTFSWLRLSPPERSLVFHLSLGSLTGGKVGEPGALNRREAEEVVALLKRLDSPKASVVQGEGVNHGLISFGLSHDAECIALRDALAKDWTDAMPRGEDEQLLRTWIEDAHELLSSLEFNRRRRGEGQREVNLAWPWGQGEPAKGMNLPLRRGFVVRHVTDSIRIAGLARLFGERVVWREGLSAEGLLKPSEPTLLIVGRTAGARQTGGLESLDEVLREVEESILEPLFAIGDQPMRLTILAPPDPFGEAPGQKEEGIGMNYDSRRIRVERQLPFDERIIAEGEGKFFPLHEAVSLALSGG